MPAIPGRARDPGGLQGSAAPTSPWGPLLTPRPSDLVRDCDRVPLTAFSLGGTTGTEGVVRPCGARRNKAYALLWLGRCWVRVPLTDWEAKLRALLCFP